MGKHSGLRLIIIFISWLFIALFNTANAKKIGISLPNYDYPRFCIDAEYMTAELESNNHTVNVTYSDRTAEQQIRDIEYLIEDNCDFLVIVPVDSFSLTNILKKAKEKKIPVISYDRLIMDSDAVNYFATFDNYKVGQLMGEYIEKKLNLNGTVVSSKNIEIFSGDSQDNNVNVLWNGVMSVLKPYLDKGVLNCVSGQIEKEQTYTKNWETEEAKLRMLKLIEEYNYGPQEGQTNLDAVLCFSDGVASGVIETLYKAGFRKKNMPVITGQDCQKHAVKFIRKGLQSVSIFKDARILAFDTAHMIMRIINGENVQVNNTDTFHNGVSIIPTLLCSPKIVDKDNMQEILIDSGFYSADELK